MNLLRDMQQTLSAVKDKVTGIDMRIDSCEARQAELEKEVTDLKSIGHHLPAKSDSRARIVPSALAVSLTSSVSCVNFSF